MALSRNTQCSFTALSDELQKDIMNKIIDTVLQQPINVRAEYDSSTQTNRLVYTFFMPGQQYKIAIHSLLKDAAFTIKDNLSNHPDKTTLLKVLGVSDAIYK